MSILYIISHDPLVKMGGTSILVDNLTKKLEGTIPVIVLFPSKSNIGIRFIKNKKYIGIPVFHFYLLSTISFLLTSIVFMKRYSINVKIAHVHGVNFQTTVLSIILKVFSKCKVILHSHGTDLRYLDSLIPKILFIFIKRADVVASVSRIQTEEIKVWLQMKNVLFLPNFLIQKKIAMDDPPRYQKTNIIYIGRVIKNKGIMDLFYCFNRLLLKNPELNLWIVGDGNYLPKLENKIKKKKIENIKLFGYMKNSDIPPILKKAGVLILPSYEEAMPFVIIEAFQSGIPVIASSVGDIPFLIKKGKNGFLVKPGDRKGLEFAIENYLRSDWDYLSSNALKRSNDFTEKRIFPRYKKIYDSLMK